MASEEISPPKSDQDPRQDDSDYEDDDELAQELRFPLPTTPLTQALTRDPEQSTPERRERIRGGMVLAMLEHAQRSGSNLDASVFSASADEHRHEIVSLQGTDLRINEANWRLLRHSVDPEAPTVVISFVGDTSAGKSHTIRQLMSEEEDRPYCQTAARQNQATTFNVNLYPCASLLEGPIVNFVDYEGENGSEAPLMGQTRVPYLSALSGRSRHEIVKEYFPKLAYTTSDVVVVVCREPFYNRQYLNRCIEFAMRANAGVENVDFPALILIGNKLPGPECILNIEQSTKQFMDAWGEEAKQLFGFFSAVVCVYLPYKQSKWEDEDGIEMDGAEVFERQMRKLKSIIQVFAKKTTEKAIAKASLMSSALDVNDMSDVADMQRRWKDMESSAVRTRTITQHQGLWFALLPRVVREIGAGRSVNVTALIDEAWALEMANFSQTEEQFLDVFRAFMTHTRPDRALSLKAPLMNEDIMLRFDKYVQLVVTISARMLAARFRKVNREVLVREKIVAATVQCVRSVQHMLDEITPCACVFPGTARAAERSDEPVVCLQEKRAHHPHLHRTSRKVRGGTGVWANTVGMIPYNQTWKGRYKKPVLRGVFEEDLAEDVFRSVFLDSQAFLEQLLRLQQLHSCNMMHIGFCPLLPAQAGRRRKLDAAGNVAGQVGTPESQSTESSAPHHTGAVVATPASPSDASAGVQLNRDDVSTASTPVAADDMSVGDSVASMPGVIESDIARQLRLSRHCRVDRKMRYCIGCGLKVHRRRKVTRAQERGWISRMLRSVLSSVGVAGSEEAAAAAEQSRIAQEVHEPELVVTAHEADIEGGAARKGSVTPRVQPSGTNGGISDAVTGGKVSASITKQTSFGTPVASQSAARGSEVGEEKVLTPIRKGATPGGTDVKRQLVWLGLCAGCWGRVEPQVTWPGDEIDQA